MELHSCCSITWSSQPLFTLCFKYFQFKFFDVIVELEWCKCQSKRCKRSNTSAGSSWCCSQWKSPLTLFYPSWHLNSRDITDTRFTDRLIDPPAPMITNIDADDNPHSTIKRLLKESNVRIQDFRGL